MNPSHREFSRRSLLLGLTALPLYSSAQNAAQRPLRFVVGFPAGGPADIGLRILTDGLGQRIAAPIVVDNRPGAGGAIASEAVAAAPADGSVFLLSGNHVSIAQALAPSPRYDAVRSFAPVARFGALPSGLFVNSNSPWTNLDTLLGQIRARPDALSYASGGNGTPSHIAMELLKRRAGLAIRHIPYKGTPPAVTDLIGGQVDMLFTSIAGPMAQVHSGRLRLLAISSPQRLNALPDVPAIAEKVSGYEFETWLGISAPHATPQAVVIRLAEDIAATLQDANTLRRLEQAGISPSFRSGARLIQTVAEETELYARTVREAAIQAQ